MSYIVVSSAVTSFCGAEDEKQAVCFIIHHVPCYIWRMVVRLVFQKQLGLYYRLLSCVGDNHNNIILEPRIVL